jgi:hypothetical protein
VELEIALFFDVFGGIAVHLRGGVDGILQILSGLADDQATGERPPFLGVDEEFAQHRVGFPSPARPAIDDDVAGAADEGDLRPLLRHE